MDIYLSENVAVRKRSGLEYGSENYSYMALILLITLQQAPVIKLKETQHPRSVAYVPCIDRILHSNKLCYEIKRVNEVSWERTWVGAYVPYVGIYLDKNQTGLH